MKSKIYCSVVTSTVLCIALVACGGNSVTNDHVPKGEGNLPIGRANGKEVGESAVYVVMSDGTMYSTFTQKQIIYAPAMPIGRTSVTVVPANRKFLKYSMEYFVGADQKWSFNIHPVNQLTTQILKGYDVNFIDNSTFHLGEKFDLETVIYGEHLEGLKVSLSINGGVAQLDANDNLVFTKLGAGLLKLEFLGVRREFNFTVVP